MRELFIDDMFVHHLKAVLCNSLAESVGF